MRAHSLELDNSREVLLRAHSALVQASTEQEIIAATALCTDAKAHLRLYYFDLDHTGQPVAVRIVASWKDGGYWEDDSLLHRHLSTEECPLVPLLSSDKNPVYFSEDVALAVGNLTSLCLENVRGLVAIKLFGAAHIEQSNQWHGFICIAWPTAHQFIQQEKYIYTAIWETASAVVSHHRLRLEALENVQRLKAVDRLKSSFLQTVSHELRTPLTAVITTTGGILAGVDGELSDELRLDVTLIHQAGEHLLKVINDLLDMASIEAGHMSLYRQQLNFADVLDEAVRTIEPIADAKGLSIMTILAPDLPAVFVDRTRLLQILLNLLSNAVKFSERGQIYVEVHQDNHMLVTAIADNGIGIRSDDVVRIFDQFHRIDSLTARRAGGTGLGLPISKRLVELHDGRLWVESEVGRGSTFYFALPVGEGTDENTVC